MWWFEFEVSDIMLLLFDLLTGYMQVTCMVKICDNNEGVRWCAIWVQLFVDSPVELYNTSARIYWPAQSTDGANIQ